MQEKYSVLMSVYIEEQPEYLKESIESMLNQTIQPEQIVIVEDGPLTGTLSNIIQEYIEEYPELITNIKIKKNVGLAKALDAGLKECRNELVARMDTDDISLSDRCEKQLDCFPIDSNLVMVGSNIDEFYDDPNNIVSSRVVPSEYDEIKKYIRRRSPFNHPTVMFKKQAVIDSGGYGKFKRKQDFDLFSRMINVGYKVTNIDESLVLFRSNEENFKRRKSWSYVKNTIDVQWAIYKRGHCSITDLIYVVGGQLFIYIIPISLFKVLSNKFLREKQEEINAL